MKVKKSKRLESIKAAHELEKTRSSSRMEDYLEIISELVELKGYATTLDISRYMNVSAPSVTKMLQRLDEGGFLEYEKYHGILLEFFEILGVGYDTANQDTEGIEHHLNPKTIKQLRKFITFLKANPKVIDNFKNL